MRLNSHAVRPFVCIVGPVLGDGGHHSLALDLRLFLQLVEVVGDAEAKLELKDVRHEAGRSSHQPQRVSQWLRCVCVCVCVRVHVEACVQYYVCMLYM